MKIIVAGKDRTHDLGAVVREQAHATVIANQGRVPVPSGISAEHLLQNRNEREFLEDYARLMRYRDGIDTHPFYIPRRPGPIGLVMAGVKKGMHKILRYLFDRVALRQNIITNMIINQTEFEHAFVVREITRLEADVQALRTEVTALRAAQAGDRQQEEDT